MPYGFPALTLSSVPCRSLALGQQYSSLGSQPILCGSIPGLVPKQLRFCRNYIEIMPSVAEGVKLGIQECQHQFRGRRWNCTTIDDSLAIFGPVLDKGKLRSWGTGGSCRSPGRLELSHLHLAFGHTVSDPTANMLGQGSGVLIFNPNFSSFFFPMFVVCYLERGDEGRVCSTPGALGPGRTKCRQGKICSQVLESWSSSSLRSTSKSRPGGKPNFVLTQVAWGQDRSLERCSVRPKRLVGSSFLPREKLWLKSMTLLRLSGGFQQQSPKCSGVGEEGGRVHTLPLPPNTPPAPPHHRLPSGPAPDPPPPPGARGAWPRGTPALWLSERSPLAVS